MFFIYHHNKTYLVFTSFMYDKMIVKPFCQNNALLQIMIRSHKVKARNIGMTVSSPARKPKVRPLVHQGCGAFEKNKQQAASRINNNARLPPVIATSFKNSGVIRLVQQYQEVREHELSEPRSWYNQKKTQRVVTCTNKPGWVFLLNYLRVIELRW